MIQVPQKNGFVGPIQPTDDDLARCVHCGLCLNACPTYRATGLETESPRGRIYLMRAVKEGRLDLGGNVPTHFDLCLVCRSCETACPSGVQFGRMMEATRAQMWQQKVRPWREQLQLRVFFQWLLPSPFRFRMAFRMLQIYQRSGLRSLIRHTGILKLLGQERRERLLPDLPTAFMKSPDSTPGRQPGIPRVGVLLGCVMSIAFRRVNEATIRILERNGCQVICPPGGWCCGALNVHGGEREAAKQMARDLIERFTRADVDVVVVNSAGCGAAMKEYHQLFVDEPEYLPTVRAFEAKVRDLSEYLTSLPFDRGFSTLPVRAVYQDACHLRHAQKVFKQPRELLHAIPGLTIAELKRPDLCCGSAGIYNVLHPDLATDVLADKMTDVLAARPQMIISGNPGCMMQIQAGLRDAGLDIPVKHIAEVLDEAYSGSPGTVAAAV